ncbi:MULTISPECIES: hypothetical protein [Ruminococcus]|uniref:Uncharacterized protein n=1 Tax=Ruminococcus flavefaciens TaxID=1265 RepID=A0A1M7L5X2_RUMFL|nr:MULTISPECIES: hypothetical protein [Ruminococcus]MCR4794174.1 hypothetical protein [Ruminococcus sp.]SHM72872.1 hypothetical protein SAMN04487860_11169 [Ruminococcus flavefaciens]
MNIKKNTTLIIMAAALSAFTGCNETKKAIEPPPSLLDVNSAPSDISFDWQQPFKATIDSFKGSERYSDDSMFDIYDLTGDDIPELIISPSSEASSKCDVYMLIGSNADLIATTGSYGTLQYIPSQTAIGFSYDGETFSLGEYLTFKEGSFNKEFDFFNNSGSAASGATIRYEINDNEVTLAKYEEYLHLYRDFVTAEVGRKYTMGDNAIDYALNYSQCWSSVMKDDQKALYKEKLSSILADPNIKDAAFEIMDLDLNGVPEVVVSTGILNDSKVCVFYLEEDGIKELDTTCDTDGGIHFDVNAKIFYATDFDGKVQCWSLAGSDISNFKPSDSTMLCGRLYPLTAENIDLAFA